MANYMAMHFLNIVINTNLYCNRLYITHTHTHTKSYKILMSMEMSLVRLQKELTL